LAITNGGLYLAVSSFQGHAIHSNPPSNYPLGITCANMLVPSGQNGSGFSLTITGAIGTPWRLWVSTNLGVPYGDWAILSNGVIQTSPFTLIDPVLTNCPTKFYHFSTP
jgi:hypothetical protein